MRFAGASLDGVGSAWVVVAAAFEGDLFGTGVGVAGSAFDLDDFDFEVAPDSFLDFLLFLV